MTSAREGTGAGAMTARARDLHRKLLERVLLRSDTQNIKNVFRRYDRERAGVLTLDQFRALVRDHDFLDTEADLLLRHLAAKEQQSVSFHAFMGDVQLGTEQNYPSKSTNASNSPKKVQQLSQLAETQQKKSSQPQAKNKPRGAAKGGKAVEMVQDPMEAIRTKLRERVMGHSKSIREVFMEYDTDGSGFLDYEEFGRFMAKYKFEPEETQTIVDYLDRDFSGTIDYDEFAAGLLFYRPPIPVPVAPVQVQITSSPQRSIDKVSRAAPQNAGVQSIKSFKTSKQADLSQVLDSMRSKFEETLKRSKQRRRDLKAEFDNYDVDGSNSLDHQEFGALLVGLGIKLKASELRAVLQEIDPDEDERIEFRTIANLLGVQEISTTSSPMKPPNVQTSIKEPRKEQRQQKAPSKADSEVFAAFNEYDHDGSGELGYDQFRSLMHDYGVNNDEEIDALIDEIDVDGSGSISYDGFVRVYSRRIKRSAKVDSEIAAMFNKYDHDGNGKLDYVEFRRLMQESSMLDNDAIDALIDEIDEAGNGFISFKEFSRVYDRGIKPSVKVEHDLLATFKKFDRDGTGEIEYSDFQRMMNEVGVKDKEVIAELLGEIDKDGRGSINFNKFASAYTRRIKPAVKTARKRQVQISSHIEETNTNDRKRSATMEKIAQASNDQNARTRLVALQEQELQFMERVLRRHNSIENAFKAFDRDGNNEMDFEQFRDFMGQYGITDEASISMLLKRLDADNSGMIDLQEFLSVFNAQRLARHKGGAPKLVPRDHQRQNNGANGGIQRTVRRDVKTITSSNTGESTGVSDAKTVNRTSKAARLRELEETWIRNALTGHDSLETAFASVDQDEDGEISRDEFRKLMNQFGVRNEEDVASLMKKLDVDGNGCVDYEEFASIFHETRVSKHPERKHVAPPAMPRRGSDTKQVAVEIESKNTRGARLRDLSIKWMKRVLGCHESIEAAFYQYDNDGNGELDHQEFGHFMKRYGIVKNDDIDTLIRRLDTDGSGMISFDEFSVIFNPLRVNPGSTAEGISAVAAAAPEEIFDPDELESILEIERELAQRMAHQTRDLRIAFRKFDTNGNGLLEYKEFRSVLKSYRLPEMEIRKVIRHLDRDVSGFIDYKEFIAGFGTSKESGPATASSPKKVEKRTSPTKGYSKPKTQIRHLPAKSQGRPKTPSPEFLKKTMLDRILAIHGTVQSAFREYDLDKEGCLNEAQFVKLVLDCGFSRDEAARLLDIFDQDQSGTVEYQEFLTQLVVK
ncbi:Calmodulin [Phytophthora citrophthora]|uniref:Calmodulin n=1 Tax=Phytophthora citrophthora TaxID=4793 RepID=A0AAD9GGU2_9STRA|nr:Calmodulin [Phytophthora citrophthora]